MTTEFTLSAFSATDDAALGDDGTISGGLANYLRRMAEPNRFLSYEMVPLATQAVIPMGQGIFMNIPSFTNDSTFGVKTLTAVAQALESLPLSASGTDATIANLRQTKITSLQRKMTYFADGFAVSKVNKNTATVQGEFERIAQFIMKTAAQTQEKMLQNNIIFETGTALTDPGGGSGVIWNGAIGGAVKSGLVAGEFIYVAPNPVDTAWGLIEAGQDDVVANNFALARKFLKALGTPGFQSLGGRMAAIIGPDTVYRLHTSVIGGPGAGAVGDASLTFEQESMNRVRTFTDAVIGDMFGFRLIETNFPITVAAGATNGPSDNGTNGAAGITEVDCEINVLFGPDAFYVTPHANLSPQLYVSGFNEGGPFNPTKSVSSLATDFMFGAVRGPEFATKTVLMPSPIA